MGEEERDSEYFQRMCKSVELPGKPRFFNGICVGAMVCVLIPIYQGAERIMNNGVIGSPTMEYSEIILGGLIELFCLCYMIVVYLKKKKEYQFSLSCPEEYREKQVKKFLTTQKDEQEYEAEKYKKHKKKRTKLDDSGAYAYMRGGKLTVEWDPESESEEKKDNE